jgi:hypothetical protein
MLRDRRQCWKAANSAMPSLMSETLRKAFERIAAELPEYEQEQFGQWVLSMIESDERDWDAQFAASLNKLAKVAAEAG